MKRRRGIRKTPKSVSQTKHAKRRGLERYGIDLDVRSAVSDIQAQKAKFISAQSLRVKIYEIEQAGKKIKVVYDKNRKTIGHMLAYGGRALTLSTLNRKKKRNCAL